MRFRISAGLLALLLATGLGCSDAGRKYSYEGFDPGAFNENTQETYTSLLGKYLDDEQLFDYQSLAENPADLQRFQEVVGAVEKQDTHNLTTYQLMAFYINAYNVLTIDLILRNFENTRDPQAANPESILNLAGNPWKEFSRRQAGSPIVSADGESFEASKTLDEIEHGILRPIGDARVHFALNCASMGCPVLHRKAFDAETLDQTLDFLASEYVNSGRPQNLSINRAARTVNFSELLTWFEQDFIDSFGSVREFFLAYSKHPNRDASWTVTADLSYDWTLNESRLGKLFHDWDALLLKYGDTDGSIDYRAWVANAEDVARAREIQARFGELEGVAVHSTWRKAFILNSYAVRAIGLLILNPAAASLDSIQGLSNAFSRPIEGKSLDQIQREALAEDVRLAFALRCGARGCAPPTNRAFFAQSVYPEIERLTGAYLAGDRVQVNDNTQTVATVESLDWYRVAIERDYGSVKAFLQQYTDVDPGKIDAYQLDSSLDFDWSKNQRSAQ